MTKKQEPLIADCFIKQAEIYEKHRPKYPDTLFEYLAELCPSHELAWDCGTGSGQAALGLVKFFNRVIASDLYPNQIKHAELHKRILYQVSSAEKAVLETQSADLIAVAQALHWFKLSHFYSEVRRILKPGGILAAWCYRLPVITPAVDEIIKKYYEEVVGAYWSDRTQFVHDRYETIPFPFEELPPPHVEMNTSWNINEIIGFLDSWSSTQKFMEMRGYHPLDDIKEDLLEAWGNPKQERLVQFPLYYKIGRNPTSENKRQKVRLELA